MMNFEKMFRRKKEEVPTEFTLEDLKILMEKDDILSTLVDSMIRSGGYVADDEVYEVEDWGGDEEGGGTEEQVMSDAVRAVRVYLNGKGRELTNKEIYAIVDQFEKQQR